MKFDRTGIILYVIRYRECLNFYENILGLKKCPKQKHLLILSLETHI